MSINKFLVGLFGAVLVAVQSGLSDGWDWRLDGLAVLTVVLGAIGVYAAHNTGVSPAIKTTVSLLMNISAAASTYFVDGVFSGANLLTAVILAGVTVGVWAVPNKDNLNAPAV
jgi:hypothetical protein